MTPEDFRSILQSMSDTDIVQQYIIDGQCVAIEASEHLRMKQAISEKYGLHPRSVVIVGSAKLGFSLAPGKRYTAFHEQSDIDVALVAPGLFDAFWRSAFLFSEGGVYWAEKKRFFEKLAQGWIRPDLMPRSDAYPIRSQWWEFFAPMRAVASFGPAKVRAGLFKDWVFLEAYQQRAVSKCRGQE